MSSLREKRLNPTEDMMSVDWTRPIQFENGEQCELIETRPEGWTQWGARADGSYPTRHIRRLGVDESSPGGLASTHWYVHEDGKVSWPNESGYNIVNG